jgi:outer membrane protein OmpA-like peptidoglycan-associated protein
MMNNKKVLSSKWAILPLLFCSAAVLAGDGGYNGSYAQLPPSETSSLTLENDAAQLAPNSLNQAQALGQQSDGFLEDSTETSSINTGYVGGNTRIGIGIDSELKGKLEATQMLYETDGSATIGQGYLGVNPKADKAAGEETLTGVGAKLSHHWVSGDPNNATHVNKVFGAYDQNELKDKKATIGYGQENANLFWSGHVSKGLSDSRTTATPGVSEKAYDLGVGGRLGAYLPDQKVRVQGGLDYEWGKDFADSEKRPTQTTLTGGVEKFFPDSPHSIGAEVEVYKKAGGAMASEDAEARGGVSYRYDIGSEAGVWQPEQRYRRIRTEIPGEQIKQPPKIERKLVKNTMELESDTFFKLDRAELTPEAKTRMQAVLAQLRASGHEGNIRITGNTCDKGSEVHNQKLSERRASAVRDFMIKNGFNGDELLAQGLGETQPKYPNTDAEGHKNRRVDIEYVTYQNEYKDEVIEQGGTSTTDPKVVWRKELIPEPPLWVRQALRNVADHKQTVDTYKTTAGTGGASTPNAPVAVNDTATTSSGTPVTIDVLANDTDPNADVLSIVGFNQGSNGVVTQVGNELVYTSEPGFIGTDSFTYIVTDPAGNQSTATVTVTVVAATSNAPVAVNDSATTTSGTPVTIDVLANDTDPNADVLSIASFNQGDNGAVTQVGNELAYTPVPGFTGTDSFTYIVTDPAGNQSTGTVTVTVVAATSNAPVTVNDSAITTSGTPVTIDVLANDTDPNADVLSIASFNQGDNGAVTQVGNELVYTPVADFTGTDSFTYIVTDPAGNQSTGTVTVTVVAATSNAPVTVNDSATTTSETPVAIDVLANDTDPNADVLSIASFNQGDNGAVTQVGNELVYTPVAGFTGADSFTYTVTDPAGNGTEATAIITVTSVTLNTPVANVDQVETMQNTPVTIMVLDNDTDPNGDTLSISAVGSEAAHGTAKQNGSSIVYTPDTGFTGDDKFTYTITNSDGNTAKTDVFVKINASGGNLSTVNDLYTVDMNSSNNLFDVISNDEVPATGATVSIVIAPGNGSASVVDNKVVYTPAANFSGLDKLKYRLTDDRGFTSETFVDITVSGTTNPGNLVLKDDYLLIALNNTVTQTLPVLANDVGDGLEIISVSTPRYGTAVVSADGKSIRYTLRSGYCNDHSFTYVVKDKYGNQAQATVVIDVLPANVSDPNSPPA